jgi:hypothetical protein
VAVDLTFTANARRLGVVSAAGTALLTAVYAATLAAGLLSLESPQDPIGDPLFSIVEVLIILTMPLMVALMVAVHAWASAETMRHHPFHVPGDRNIRDHQACGPSSLRYLTRERRQLIFPPRSKNHLGPSRCEDLGRRPANSAARSGNQNHFAIHVGHLVPPRDSFCLTFAESIAPLAGSTGNPRF